MASIRVFMTLVLALTFGLALPVAAQPLRGTDLVTGLFGGGPFVEQLCESLLRRLCPRPIVGGEEGESNTALGAGALGANTTGFDNTALGVGALSENTTGANNTAVGHNAGSNLTTGDNNIHIGNQGTAADSGLIRIGTVGTQTATFIAGISGQTSASGVAVLVNAAGQLGTTTSSQRAKDEIRDMSVASDGVLKLRPVTFRYKPEHDDGSRLLQYGLITEEVAEVYPELAVLDKDGQPSGVRYHVLPAMLLNELQRQQRQLTAQQQELDELRAQVRALIKERAAIVERNVDPERR
jgi:Chaperone of endosialidase